MALTPTPADRPTPDGAGRGGRSAIEGAVALALAPRLSDAARTLGSPVHSFVCAVVVDRSAVPAYHRLSRLSGPASVSDLEVLAGVDPAALSDSERDELTRLRRETAQLRTDNEILRKAAAYFARETHR